MNTESAEATREPLVRQKLNICKKSRDAVTEALDLLEERLESCLRSEPPPIKIEMGIYLTQVLGNSPYMLWSSVARVAVPPTSDL